MLHALGLGLAVILEIAYVCIWSAAYYYQLYMMVTLKSGKGFSLDYQYLSTVSMGFYACYNTYFFFSKAPSFYALIDMLFSVHATAIHAVLICLTYRYPRGINRVHGSIIWVISIMLCLIAVYYLLGVKLAIDSINGFFLYLACSKINFSVVKYLYQIFLSYERKSTKGYSIVYVACNLVGASLSVAQLLAEKAVDARGRFNYPKMALGLITMSFELGFMYQHYVLYGPENILEDVSLMEAEGLSVELEDKNDAAEALIEHK